MFEDTKGEIRSPKSKKDRQHNDQKKKDRQHNDQKKNDKATLHRKKDRETRFPLKTGVNSCAQEW